MFKQHILMKKKKEKCILSFGRSTKGEVPRERLRVLRLLNKSRGNIGEVSWSPSSTQVQPDSCSTWFFPNTLL